MKNMGYSEINDENILDSINEPYYIKQNNPFMNLSDSEGYEMDSLKNNDPFNCGLLFISDTNSNESKLFQKSENIITIIENVQTKGLSNNTIYTNEKIINSKNGNSELKFTVKKKGRPKKGQENQGNKIHTRKSNDNARKRIINSCKSSIYNLIAKQIPTQLDIKLHIPTIEKQMGYSCENINKFLNKKIYNIFCDTIPKKLKNEIKNNPEQYQHNKNIIDMLLENEIKDENKQIKILNGLFNLCFKDFLIAYLNDETEIKISDDIIISLKGFKTFGSSFNERKTGYNQSQKNVYKKNILEIIYNSKRNRKAKK